MAETNKKITQINLDKELETLSISLSGKVGRTALTLTEYIQLRQIQGATLANIRADLLVDLSEGGRIFGEFVNALKPTFAGSIHRFRDVGALTEMGVETKYRWVAVLVNTCPDCLDRHNKIRPWTDWEADGLPRTGATVCKENCKCVLIPEEAIEISPVMRAK